MSEPTTFEQWMTKANELVKRVESEDEELDVAEANELVVEAAHAYEKAHELNKEDAHCLYQWGRALFTLAEFVDTEEDSVDDKIRYIDSAIARLQQAEKLSPESADILFHLAQAHSIKCDLLVEEVDDRDQGVPLMQKAVEIFDRAYAAREKQIEAGAKNTNGELVTKSMLVDVVLATVEAVSSLGCLAQTEAEADKLFEDAFARIERALDLAPERRAALLHEWATSLQAQASFRQDSRGQLDQSLYEPAITKLEEAIAADTTCTDAVCTLAELHLSMAHGRIAQAALGANADDEDAEFEEAKEDEEKMTKLIDARIAAVDGEVLPRLVLGCKTYARAVEMDPKNASMHQLHGDALFGRSQLPIESSRNQRDELMAEAETKYRTALTLEKECDESGLLLRLAQVLHFQKREEECAEVLKQWTEGGLEIDSLYDADDVFEQEFMEKVFGILGEEDEDDDDYEDEEE